ncbi:hypothetical protein ACFSC6_21410 [Rufibacter sediminis]|nr:hypothetical protein [Rufibacter sediminis]
MRVSRLAGNHDPEYGNHQLEDGSLETPRILVHESGDSRQLKPEL